MTEYWATLDVVDMEARQRAVVETYAREWADNPPTHPIIVAGSTGSRGATAFFMQAVANLPQGAVVLPGVDQEMPPLVWDILTNKESNDDHPQSMLARLVDKLGLGLGDVQPWAKTPVFSKARNKLTSLALRPAPVTDQWLEDGPALIPYIEEATQNISMVSAKSPKEEASVIALCLREALERSETAVLISPDRHLTRRVAAHLNRWKIIPDDSAGEPLHLTPAGIFLRLTAGLLAKDLAPADLIAALKHPYAHKANGRNNHLRFTHDLELAELDRDTPLMRGGPPVVDFQLLKDWADKKAPDVQNWVAWLVQCFDRLSDDTKRPMSDWIELHHTLLVQLSTGATGGFDPVLWGGNDGQKAQKVFENLQREAKDQTIWAAADYMALLQSQLKSEDVRDAVAPHPNIAIWGTLEARVQGADRGRQLSLVAE